MQLLAATLTLRGFQMLSRIRMAAAAWLLLTTVAASAAPPDLTGIWTMGADGRAGASLNGPGDFEKTAPFTPSARKRLAEYHALVDATGDTPGAHCVPHGMPLAVFLGGGYPVEFVQRPEQLTIIYETHNEVRRVFLDGRRIPANEILPSRAGVSYGHWEGDTLVVETDNLVDQVDQRTTSHSDQATIVERYSLDGKDEQGRRILKAEMTMTDPGFYTAPVKQTKRWAEVPNGRALPYECPEEMWNDRIEKLAKEAGVPVP
jgi:hypothetical protein